MKNGPYSSQTLDSDDLADSRLAKTSKHSKQVWRQKKKGNGDDSDDESGCNSRMDVDDENRDEANDEGGDETNDESKTEENKVCLSLHLRLRLPHSPPTFYTPVRLHACPQADD